MRAAAISRSFVYRLIRRGTLAARRFGGAQYVRGEDLDELVRRRGERQDVTAQPFAAARRNSSPRARITYMTARGIEGGDAPLVASPPCG